MELYRVPKSELQSRMERFTKEMDSAFGYWELCAITGGVNIFYLTGTICDGLVLIRRKGERTLWVRRSFERAVIESEFGDVRRMTSFRDVAGAAGRLPATIYIDAAHATLEWYGMLSKYMKFENTLPLDAAMLRTRSIKSEYELERMRRAGTTIDRLFKEALPDMLREGISEAELGAELFALFLKNGFHGISRLLMRNAEMIFGHIAFGEGPLYPSAFNGASGIAGQYPATPVLGSFDRRLREGDLIYIDVSTGFEGYNVDRTRVYSYKCPQPRHVVDAHRLCLELEDQAAQKLRPGVWPSQIYKSILDILMPEYKECFMGAPGRTVPFLGHGVGLCVDEAPVIAKGYDAPLEKGMTIAIEPKIAVEGAGMVGIENTYLVTDKGGVSLTGESTGIITIG